MHDGPTELDLFGSLDTPGGYQKLRGARQYANLAQQPRRSKTVIE